MSEGRVARAWEAVGTVLDPEVPVLSVVELGIVRHIIVDGERVVVTVTPTYTGCPAMATIERDITAALTASGFSEVRMQTVYAPAWTTDWMSDAAREKLRVYGIAPPGLAPSEGPVSLGPTVRAVPCPWCGSAETRTVSEFGATACKSLHFCRGCQQPFEHVKPF